LTIIKFNIFLKKFCKSTFLFFTFALMIKHDNNLTFTSNIYVCDLKSLPFIKLLSQLTKTIFQAINTLIAVDLSIVYANLRV
jgi:hypothetical protein